MSTLMHQIIQSKEAERRRLRQLPWLVKLEMLDKLRQRHLWLRDQRTTCPGSYIEDPGHLLMHTIEETMKPTSAP